MHHVTGIFSRTEPAEAAVRDLIEEHFDTDDISIMVTDAVGTHEEELTHDTGVSEGAVAGAVLGGLLGVLGVGLVATGVLVAPGLPLLAAGPIAAALKGGVVGAAVGLEVGALGGLGFWKDEAHIHAQALREGGIVVAVPADHEHAEHARKVFREAGADEVRG